MHEKLKKLPVSQQIDSIDWENERILCLAETGSGKTICLAPQEAIDTGRSILMRQPTKLATSGVARGLEKFWPDLEIGLSTKDRKENIEDADIIVYSDGSLSGLMKKVDDPVVYFDEIHALNLVSTEVEMALCKERGVPMRLLSATVDPSNLHQYLPGLVEHRLSGRAFPIKKDVVKALGPSFDPSSDAFFNGFIRPVVWDVHDRGEHALFFLRTRAQCEQAAKRVTDVDATFAHGGVYPPDLEEWVEEKGGDPWVIFATVAAATSITIDVGSVFIVDDQQDSIQRGGTTFSFRRPVDNNTLLQMAGRAGRLREGEAILITSDASRSWDNVHPEPIIPPSEKTTPYEVVMSMVELGLPIDTPLLGRVQTSEMEHAERWLRDAECIDASGLTTLGRKINSGINLPIPLAHLAATSATVNKPFALASMVAQSRGLYSLLKVKPNTKEYYRARHDPSFSLVPKEIIPHRARAPVLLGRLMQQAFMNKHRLLAWCREGNLNYQNIKWAMKDYQDAAARLGIKDAVEALKGGGFDEERFANHFIGHPTVQKAYLKNGWGSIIVPGGDRPVRATFCGITKDIYRLESSPWVRVAGMPKLVTSRTGNVFAVLECPVVMAQS
jgi:HrpA-like RNA helicase